MDEVPKMPHIKFKPTTRIAIDFDPNEINYNLAPEESKIEVKKYLKSNKLNDGSVLLFFENETIFGFDHLYNNEKILIPEINPVTIFFSNAVMSHRLLLHYKAQLLDNSPRVKNMKGTVDPNYFGQFFQLASTIIINLQATVESLANRIIPMERKFIDRNDEPFEPSLFHKINIVLPEIRGKKFKSKHGKQHNLIRILIELRNEIIHLKPAGDPNSVYKAVYRRIINFKFTETIYAVRQFADFYEENLIEECSCKKEYFYNINIVE